ncbi:MarR family winged helix-turn-helix transcriptional regulator [Actinophytocola oryzae]|uniref:MarR family winged helix-turn-helix transcriptional regulator n=1 Tax=Actinophytocola oryzae TaxID=502181 RepID=UPI001AAE9D80|nr:MarR family transcriptional regulator [Actinophytocola oryzae]
MAAVPDDRDLLGVLDELVLLFIGRRDAFFAAHNVPPAQSNLLLGLHERGKPASMTELAVAQGVVPRTITSLVDGLEQRGLARRTADPKDRRAILVSLTEKGLALVDRLELGKANLATAVFARLTERERVTFGHLLRKLSIAPPGEGTKQ